MIRSWKKLSEKTLLLHPRLHVYEDEIELPSGHKTTYVRFGDGEDSAMVIAKSHDNKILVQKEYSYPPNEWLYQFPGGGLEKGEQPKAAALREFAEEAGYTGKLQKLGTFYLNNRRTAHKSHIFLATQLTTVEAQPDIEEAFESYWYTENEIDELIAKGQMTNQTLLAGWALYSAKVRSR